MITGVVLLTLLLAACGQQTTSNSNAGTTNNSSGDTPAALENAASTSAPPNASAEVGAATPGTVETAVANTGSTSGPSGTIVPRETAASAGATTQAAGNPGGATGETSVSSTSAPSTGGSAGGNGATIVVGSKDFTEEFIVAEMYALLLENNGFKVERKLNLGGTPIAQQALVNKQIDLYPEYTSTGLLEVLKDTKTYSSAQQIYDAVKSGYEQQFQITWLQPAPFNDSNTFAVTQETAQKYNLKTFSDLFAHAADLRLGGPAEFPGRDDTKHVEQVYNTQISKFKEYVQLGTGPLRYDALKSGQVDAVVAFGTDGRIGADNLVVLQDDKNAYPIYQIAPVVRQDVLQANPAIADTLNKLAPLLTDQVMASLNAKVDVDGQAYEDVAQEFLKQQGLIK
jgi:osmoprotectant transport system substrate-binding protein